MTTNNFPYFDYIFKQLSKGEDQTHQVFNKHVHWGYWEDPDEASLTHEDFVTAQERLSHQLIELASPTDGSRILDVGCGFGGTISTLNDHLQNVELIGLNIDSKQLEYAQDMVIARETNQIDFVAGDACKLPFPDNNFDTVLAVECIFHFPSRKEFFSEVRRVLKPSGTLVLSDYVPMWFLKPVALLINSPLCEGNNPYGHSNMNITFGSYRRLAKANQMSMSSKDATANVRPTYDFIDKHYIDHYFEEMKLSVKIKNQFRKANSFAKWDLVRYYLMAFQLGVKS